MAELVLIMYRILLPILRSENALLLRKLAILKLLGDTFTPQSTADIYYNFDNMHGIEIFESLVDSISNLCVCAMADPLEDGKNIIGYRSSQSTYLQTQCLDIICSIIKHLIEWNDITREKNRKMPSTDGTKLSEISINEKEDRIRIGTVTERFGKNISNKKLVEEAIKIANSGNPSGRNLRKAFDYLISNCYMKRNADEISKFLHKNINEINIEEVGMFLGGTRPKDEVPFEEEVRLAYFKHISFYNPFIEVRLDNAMRILLTESGFRLPKESKPIERIINSFQQPISIWRLKILKSQKPSSLLHMLY